MRKVALSLFLVAIVVLAAGCVGKSTGLTEEKVIKAIKNIKTAHYDENFTMAMDFTIPDDNTTVNMTMHFRIKAMMDRMKKRALGNYTGWVYYNGLNITFNWPLYIEGNDTYLKVDGKWYNATDNQETGAGSYNLDAIRAILNSTNVSIMPVDGGYQFKLNVTFEQFANATGRTYALDRLFEINGTVETHDGWVLVKLKRDGTPYYIETYFDLTLNIPHSLTNDTIPVHVIVHDSEALNKINEPVVIEKPKGVENAPRFDGLWD
ncbi:hypothetical protein [Thermococcus sp.]|uniref:hypothetical protein n=1 Tax=Thermococcus sp. TaxID=35749 RepID=UPI0026335431|nr:hypothetical protein [Thermococcus sp.]